MAQAQAPPAAPVKKRRGCLGCGCGGSLLAILLIVVLVAAAIFFFAILPASAGSDTPTTLSVFVPNAEVSSSQNGTYTGGTTGKTLTPGTWVKTDQAGRGAINFPDGSITRLATSTQVGITQATLDSHGQLHHANLQQEAGRTLSTVQGLIGGRAILSLRGGTADSAGARSRLATAQRIAALLLAVTAVCMGAARYA